MLAGASFALHQNVMQQFGKLVTVEITMYKTRTYLGSWGGCATADHTTFGYNHYSTSRGMNIWPATSNNNIITTYNGTRIMWDNRAYQPIMNYINPSNCQQIMTAGTTYILNDNNSITLKTYFLNKKAMSYTISSYNNYHTVFYAEKNYGGIDYNILKFKIYKNVDKFSQCE